MLRDDCPYCTAARVWTENYDERGIERRCNRCGSVWMRGHALADERDALRAALAAAVKRYESAEAAMETEIEQRILEDEYERCLACAVCGQPFDEWEPQTDCPACQHRAAFAGEGGGDGA